MLKFTAYVVGAVATWVAADEAKVHFAKRLKAKRAEQAKQAQRIKRALAKRRRARALKAA